MCDTFVYRNKPANEIWFCKNSDREPDEPQLVEFHPSHNGATTQQATYIAVDVPAQRHGVLLSRPEWLWGAEIGVNEHGVSIGNEAVFTKLNNKKGSALLGMDLLRLALEQASTAEAACNTIIEYLEQYGQGGPAGYKDKSFRYDNAFIIADNNIAIVLDTAGEFWAKQYVSTSAAISNDLSISTDYDAIHPQAEAFARQRSWHKGTQRFNFRKAFRTRFMPWMGKADERRASNLNALNALGNTEITAPDFMSLLRQHKQGKPSSNADVCMHAKGLLRPSATTNSFIVKLAAQGNPVVWSSFGQPCENEYQEIDWQAVAVS